MAERTVVKTVENAILYSDGSILVKGVRFSYPHAITPQAGQVDKITGKLSAPSYSLTGLMPKSTHRAAMQLIKGEIDRILLEKKASVKADFKFLRDGNASGKDDYLDHFTISCRETVKKPPSVRGPDGVTKLTEADDGKVIYGGCWGNILLRPWFMNNTYGKRVNANFIACQVTPARGRNAEPLGETNRISEDQVSETFENEATESDWEPETSVDDLDTQGL